MFQFAKFEKSKECRLAMELGYGFPIGDPWITDGISPWPFASESVVPSQCPGIHPMHSFRSCTPLASHRLHKLRCGTRNTNPISTKKIQVQATPSLMACIPDVKWPLDIC
ncbi:putative mitochondrial protein [Sesamum alatum]|uniref:Mitochondrial protein n=1 Tax=Sesamum alatum TaxID=300844 RepID=A0AAE1XMK5_9LAMI|nr:putative mitochondrial protein [Sesamum alatum]